MITFEIRMEIKDLHKRGMSIRAIAREPGSGKTRTARLWVYVRDDRNAGSVMPPAVWFAYSPDRKGVHPQPHLSG